MQSVEQQRVGSRWNLGSDGGGGEACRRAADGNAHSHTAHHQQHRAAGLGRVRVAHTSTHPPTPTPTPSTAQHSFGRGSMMVAAPPVVDADTAQPKQHAGAVPACELSHFARKLPQLPVRVLMAARAPARAPRPRRSARLTTANFTSLCELPNGGVLQAAPPMPAGGGVPVEVPLVRAPPTVLFLPEHWLTPVRAARSTSIFIRRSGDDGPGGPPTGPPLLLQAER